MNQFIRINIQNRLLILVLVVFFSAQIVESQSRKRSSSDGATSAAVADSIAKANTDSIANDSIFKSTQKKKNSPIDAEIQYKANDSIVLYGNSSGYLYGNSEVKYLTERPIELTADYIRIKMDSSLIYASGTLDSVGDLQGTPVFKEGAESYNSKSIAYNLRSRKGYIRGGITEQGEGYIVADRTKKINDDELCMAGGKYTTCNNHDHPHFYFQLTKGKVKQGKNVVSGPAYLVMQDVPLPIAVPFGFFPFTSSYSSGIIMPTFGDEYERGFYLREGGFYFAINDYVDLELLGDIYTKGTWALSARSKYTWRYKFSGNLSLSYREDVIGEKGLVGYNKSNNFRISWTHTQDAKFSQYSTFSASVDYTTSGYNQSNVNNYYNPAEQSKNVTSSSINFTQRFPDSPWTLSLNAGVSQRTADSTISLTLPNLTVSMSRIYPFKRKNAIGKEKFYEKIALSYNMSFANSIDTKEDKLLTSNFAKDWRNGIDHRIPISASFNVFKYLNITPSINYHERWYFNKVMRSWDDVRQEELRDTTNGFYRVYDFGASVSMSTKLYGYYIPIRKIFGDHIDRIRHVFTPSVSFNYTPDFGNSVFKFYDSYQRTHLDKGSTEQVRYETITYSPYSNGMYGVPGRGTQAALSFSLGNNLEMKVKDKKDTTKVDPYKKISLIDNFSISGGYNFAADSMNWSNFNASVRIKITKSFSLNLSGAFDPYMYALDDYGRPVRVNQLRWDNGKFPFFMGTSTSFQYTINNDTFKRKDKKSKKTEESDELESPLNMPDTENRYGDANNNKESSEGDAQYDSDGYMKNKIDWSFSFNYSVRWAPTSEFNYEKLEYKRDFTHSLSFNGHLNPTPKWRLNYTGTFDMKKLTVTQMTFSIVRDLHCWNMSASVTPIGYYKSFMVTIGINASMLRDVKIEKRSDSTIPNSWF